MNEQFEIIKNGIANLRENAILAEEFAVFHSIITAAEAMKNKIAHLEKQLSKSPAERENDKLYEKLAGR